MNDKTHIAFADVQMAGSLKSPYVSVVFYTTGEIDRLIDILTALKQASEEGAHCHLQNHDYQSAHEAGIVVQGTEIYFYGPKVQDTPAELEIRTRQVEQFWKAVEKNESTSNRG